jgi:hypothetical protein
LQEIYESSNQEMFAISLSSCSRYNANFKLNQSVSSIHESPPNFWDQGISTLARRFAPSTRGQERMILPFSPVKTLFPVNINVPRAGNRKYIHSWTNTPLKFPWLTYKWYYLFYLIFLVKFSGYFISHSISSYLGVRLCLLKTYRLY